MPGGLSSFPGLQPGPPAGSWLVWPCFGPAKHKEPSSGSSFPFTHGKIPLSIFQSQSHIHLPPAATGAAQVENAAGTGLFTLPHPVVPRRGSGGPRERSSGFKEELGATGIWLLGSHGDEEVPALPSSCTKREL